MSRSRPYGRAYKISEAEARAYERTSRPRRYTPNPLGVTAMASVNGRGAYKSARAVADGKTRAERLERARRVIRNGEHMAKRAGFLKNRRRAMRRNEVAHEGWQEVDDNLVREYGEGRGRVQYGPEPKAKKTRARNTKKAAAKKAKPISATAKKAKAKRGGKRLAAFMAAKRAGKSVEAAKRAALRAVPLKTGETFKGSVKRKATKKRKQVRVIGAPPVKKTKAKKTKTYTRLSVVDPRTGKKRLSFLTKGKKGRRVKIPVKAMISSKFLTEEKIKKARQKAADRILKSGDAFTPNKKKRKSSKKKGSAVAKGKKKVSAKAKRAGKRLAAYMAAMKRTRSKTKARSAALRAVPLKDGDTFAGGGVAKKRKATKKKKGAAKRTKRSVKKRGSRKTVKKASRLTKRQKAARKAAATRRRNAAAKAAPVRRRRRKAAKKVARKSTRKTAKKKTTKKRKMRRNGRGSVVRYTSTGQPSVVRRRKSRRMRKNSFLAQLKSVAISGLFVAGGFLTHKVVTNLLVTNVYDKMLAGKAPASLENWKKPIVGAVTLLVGVPLTNMAIPKRSTEITAGMAASLVQSIIVSLLTPKKPAWAASLQGYENSRAYSLRGPMERNATSIAPQYTNIGAFQQAAAGYEQAAAGYLQAAAGTGEYFQTNGTGEYFAASGLQGVGSYEAAGSLAMQAAAGADDIDDGIRPDSDIDGLLDLAEAAAGLRGTGEFYTAIKESGGRIVSKRVGESSQWIPAGPLWAGADFVEDTQDTSELSAGILQKTGGNGILSAG